MTGFRVWREEPKRKIGQESKRRKEREKGGWRNEGDEGKQSEEIGKKKKA